MEQIVRLSKRTVFSLIQRFQKSETHSAVRLPEPSKDAPPWDDAAGNSSAPMSFIRPAEQKPDPDRDPQFQYILLKCPVIRSIVEKIRRERMVTNQESQVLIYSLGHLDNGPDIVNGLFDLCVNADSALYLKTKLSGNPVSCPKIRTRVPAISSSVNCNCVFDLSVNLYPTPLIHIHSMSEKSKTAALIASADSIQFQNLLQEYLSLRTRMQEIALSLNRYESKLNEFFEQAGLDSVQTPMGNLKRTRDPVTQRTSFFLELPGLST